MTRSFVWRSKLVCQSVRMLRRISSSICCTRVLHVCDLKSLKRRSSTANFSLASTSAAPTCALLLDRQRFTTTLLTDGKSRNNLQAVRRDGKQVVVASNMRNGRDMDLYIGDPRSPETPRLLMEVDRQTWNASDWSPDGKTIALSVIRGGRPALALIDPVSGDVRREVRLESLNDAITVVRTLARTELAKAGEANMKCNLPDVDAVWAQLVPTETSSSSSSSSSSGSSSSSSASSASN